jgi:hypothetical protein
LKALQHFRVFKQIGFVIPVKALDKIRTSGKNEPNLKSAILKMLAAYHLTDNFPDVDSEVKDDNTVKYFYLSPDINAKHTSIDATYWNQIKVKSYGPFYNIGGRDVPKGQLIYIFIKQ